jgi:hypothetical protein
VCESPLWKSAVRLRWKRSLLTQAWNYGLATLLRAWDQRSWK